MNSRQARALATNPTAMIRYQTTGRLPGVIRPDSPLIRLLEQYTPRQRVLMRGVQLSPKLGYISQMRFHTGEQLYRWLKPAPEMLEIEPFPAESHRIKRFNRVLTERDLREACAQFPDR